MTAMTLAQSPQSACSTCAQLLKAIAIYDQVADLECTCNKDTPSFCPQCDAMIRAREIVTNVLLGERKARV